MLNSGAGKYRRGNRQQGAAMVEMAIVITLFLVLVFGIIEFALVIFHVSLLDEATRAGARYAIVNDPACDIYGKYKNEPGFNSYDCSGGALVCSETDPNYNSEETVKVAGNCEVDPDPLVYDLKDGDAGCSIVERMRAIQPLITLSDPVPDVLISYACTDAGFAGLVQKIPAVTVKICDEDDEAEIGCNPLEYNLILPGLLKIPAKITMPAFATTRTGEDLDTVTAPP